MIRVLPDGVIILIHVGIIILITSIYIWLFKKKQIRFNWPFFFLTILHIFAFYLVYDLHTVPPEINSGNGNPSILFMVPLLISFIIYNITLGFCIFDFMKNFNFKVKLLILLSALFLFFIFVNKEILFSKKLIGSLKVSIQKNWFLDIHTNSIYYNAYTFTISLLFTLITTILIAFIKKT